MKISPSLLLPSNFISAPAPECRFHSACCFHCRFHFIGILQISFLLLLPCIAFHLQFPLQISSPLLFHLNYCLYRRSHLSPVPITDFIAFAASIADLISVAMLLPLHIAFQSLLQSQIPLSLLLPSQISFILPFPYQIHFSSCFHRSFAVSKFSFQLLLPSCIAFYFAAAP